MAAPKCSVKAASRSAGGAIGTALTEPICATQARRSRASAPPDAVPAGGQALGQGPAEIAVDSRDEDAHGRAPPSSRIAPGGGHSNDAARSRRMSLNVPRSWALLDMGLYGCPIRR
ncbi:hypothetical protein GCM10020000_55820 [Streptomyces olivoverticillatus]